MTGARLGYSDKVTDPRELEVVRLTIVAQKLLMPRIRQFLAKQSRTSTSALVASNALIAALQDMLATQMAMHAALTEMTELERGQLFDVTIAATRQNFDRSVHLYTERMAAMESQGATRQ